MSSSKRQRRTRYGPGCTGQLSEESQRDLVAIVRAYKMRFRRNTQEELGSYAAEATLAAAVRRASLAQRPDGRRYDHQRRLPMAVLREASDRLEGARLEVARDFGELHHLVEQAIGLIPGIGELTVYDTALRIGAKLRLKPDRVYLHRGTREGARALGLNWRLPQLALSEVPRALHGLEPHEIEDCLCIFKRQLAAARAFQQRVRAGSARSVA